VAVCSAHLDRARDAAQRFGAPQAFDDHDAMIEAVRPDVVYVGAPVGLHAPMVTTAVAAGCHVICEKPLARDASEARTLAELVAGAGVAHAVTFTMRWFPAPATVRRLVHEGVIGVPRHLHVSFWFGLPPEVPRRWTWMNDRDAGGGLLAAMGSHYLDLARWWLGDLEVRGAVTSTWRGQLPDDEGVPREATADDAFALVARAASGASVTLHASGEVVAPPGPRIELVGSEATLLLDGLEAATLLRPGVEASPIELDDPITDADAAACAAPRFGMVVSGLLASRSGHATGVPTFDDALAVEEAIDAARRMAE
jgi:predicted dehydrogenase